MSDAIRWMSARKFREGMKSGEIKDQREVGIHVGFNAKTQVINAVDDGDDASRQMLFAISSEAVDRDTDTVAIDGWDLANYRNNPVVLFGHNYWNNVAPVVGKSLSEFIEKKMLKSLMEFTPQGTVPLADTLYALYANGFMHATSVGFIASDFEFVEDDLDRPWGIDFLEQELLEYSLVPVPSNPEALAEARSKSINTEPLFDWTGEILDEWKAHKSQSFWLPKTLLREIRAQADPKQRTTAQVPKGVEMRNQATAKFVEALTPEMAEHVVRCSVSNSSDAEAGGTLAAGEYTWIDDSAFHRSGFGFIDGTKLAEPLEFNPSQWQIVLDKAAEAEPETKHTVLACPACGEELEVQLEATDADKAIECECGEDLVLEDGALKITLADDDVVDPLWLRSLRASGAPESVIQAAQRAHARGDAATSDNKDGEGDDAFELSDDMVALLETLGVDVNATLAKEPDASNDSDDSIDLESIEVVDEDGTRCGLRSFFEQILPESIDEGVKAAIENVLQPK